MGASGVGKSTLIDLLVGLLLPQSGAVEVDDEALTRANLGVWQGSIGYVPQKVYLFEDSIARNVAVSERSHTVDLERVMQVCRIARFHDFVVNELENGYETLVGQGRKELSGGQLKRLGIARALYRGPKVIVMDEATTELDAATEAEILSEIMLMKGLTKIFISHDIALARRCDHLIYFDRDGKITEGDPAILEEIGFARLLAAN
jgi:ABC-type multidrug transport system fused ATPase/permease subunit